MHEIDGQTIGSIAKVDVVVKLDEKHEFSPYQPVPEVPAETENPIYSTQRQELRILANNHQLDTTLLMVVQSDDLERNKDLQQIFSHPHLP